MIRSSAWVRRLKRAFAFTTIFPLLGCGGDDAAPPVEPSAVARAISAFSVSSDEQAVISPGTAFGSYIPDEHLSFLRQTDGSFRLWVTGSART